MNSLLTNPFAQKLLASVLAAAVIVAAFTLPQLAGNPAAQATLSGIAAFLMGAVGVKSEGLRSKLPAPIVIEPTKGDVAPANDEVSQ